MIPRRGSGRVGCGPDLSAVIKLASMEKASTPTRQAAMRLSSLLAHLGHCPSPPISPIESPSRRLMAQNLEQSFKARGGNNMRNAKAKPATREVAP